MRFIADEGVDKAIVEALRGVGRDVRWIAEELQGAKDDAILNAAARDARLLVTEDRISVNSSTGRGSITAASSSFAWMVFPIWKRVASSLRLSLRMRRNSRGLSPSSCIRQSAFAVHEGQRG